MPSKSKSKTKVGIALDHDIVEWLNSVVEELSQKNITVTRSSLVNSILKNVRANYDNDQILNIVKGGDCGVFGAG